MKKGFSALYINHNNLHETHQIKHQVIEILGKFLIVAVGSS